MRLRLTLATNEFNPVLPVNYQYPFSAAIYKIIQRADATYSAFLHNSGYGENHKRFKLFTFSDLNVPFQIVNDRLLLKRDNAKLVVCFHLPQAAENFIKGLFMHQQLEIADVKSKATFIVQQIEAVSNELINDRLINDQLMNISVQPLSPIVTGRKNDKGYYDYRSPSDADFTDCLLHNWTEKYKTVNNVDENCLQQIKEQTKIKVHLFSRQPQQRLITFKQGTAEETRIRGYMKFRLQLTASKEMVKLALNAGLGLYNSMGCGGKLYLYDFTLFMLELYNSMGCGCVEVPLH